MSGAREVERTRTGEVPPEQMSFNHIPGQAALDNSQTKDPSRASSRHRREDEDSALQEQKVVGQTDGGEFDIGQVVAAGGHDEVGQGHRDGEATATPQNLALSGEDGVAAESLPQPQDAEDGSMLNVSGIFGAQRGRADTPTSGGPGQGTGPASRRKPTRLAAEQQTGSDQHSMKQSQVCKNLVIDGGGSSGPDQHENSIVRQQSSAQHPGGTFNSYHKESDAKSASLVPESLGSRPPIVTTANKTQIDNFYRSKQAGNVHMSLLGANPLSGSAIASANVDNRQRANSFNYTGAFAASKQVQKQVAAASIGPGEQREQNQNVPQTAVGSGRERRSKEERILSGSVADGSKNNMSNKRQIEKESNSRDQPNSNHVLNSSMLEKSRVLDKAEILSQQHLVMHAPINNNENPQRSLRINQQSVSVNNFNSYAEMNNQVQLQQSQGGGGGFARGTIYKGGKNWKIGGMAANATFNNKPTKLGANLPTPSQRGALSHHNDQINKSQNLTVYRQASATNQVTPHQAKHPNETAMTAGSNFTHGHPNRQAHNDNMNNQRQFKFSDAGSRRSFITHKRGLPRTLWQPGALFSTRMSRASVSAGKHVPHYFLNQNGLGMGMKDGGSLYNGMVGPAPEVLLSGSHVNQFNATHGTQGFTRQKYEQMAQNINRDINRNQMKADSNSALKLQKSNMSESGAYGIGAGVGVAASGEAYHHYNNMGAAPGYLPRSNFNQATSNNQNRLLGSTYNISNVQDDTISKNNNGRLLPRGSSKDILHHNFDQDRPFAIDPSGAQRRAGGSHIEYNNSVFKNRPFSSENKYGVRGIFRRNHQNILFGGQRVNRLDLNHVDHQLGMSAYQDPAHIGAADENQRATSALNNKERISGGPMAQFAGDDQYLSAPQSAGLRPKNASNKLNHDFTLPPINQKMNQGQFGEVLGDFEGFNKVKLELDTSGMLLDHHPNRVFDPLGLQDQGLGGAGRLMVPADGMGAGLSRLTEKLLYPVQTNYEKKEERLLGQRIPEIIWLRVYHVTPVNKYLLEWLGFGFYHTSVELYNHEFAYGGHDYDFSGIVCVETIDENTKDPQKIAQASAASGGLELKERIPVGMTYYSMDEIDDIVIYFGNFWHGGDYDPFAKNCNNFAEAFISHISDKEQYYYPSYVNRFTKLGSVLRGWFKPLQTLFGEIVELEQDVDEEEEARLNEFGFEERRDNEFMAIPGGANGGSNANSSARKPDNAASGVQDDPKKEEAVTGKTSSHNNIDPKAKEDNQKRQLSMISGNQVLAADNMISSPTNVNRKNNQQSRVFSPASQIDQRNPRDSAQKPQMSHTEQKTQNIQLDQLLSSPTQNIKVSQIIDITHQQMNHGSNGQVVGQGLGTNMGDTSNQNLNIIQNTLTPSLELQGHQVSDQVNGEDITARLYEKGNIVVQSNSQDQENQQLNSNMVAAQNQGNLASANVNNLAEEPVENIKARADEHFSRNQFQHAMKFYEICLGKITAVTEVDINEDAYMMNLTVQTYIGICDSAHHLGLTDHLIHFATQCMKIDEKNTQNQMHVLLHKRARANLSQGMLEAAKQDLERALTILRVPFPQTTAPTFGDQQASPNKRSGDPTAEGKQIVQDPLDIEGADVHEAADANVDDDQNSQRGTARMIQADREEVLRLIKEQEQEASSEKDKADVSNSKAKKDLDDDGNDKSCSKSQRNAWELLEQNEEAAKARTSGDKTAGKDTSKDAHIQEVRDDKRTPKRDGNAFRPDDDTETELNLLKTLNEQGDKDLANDDELLKRTISQDQHMNIQHANQALQRQQSRSAVKNLNDGGVGSPSRPPIGKDAASAGYDKGKSVLQPDVAPFDPISQMAPVDQAAAVADEAGAGQSMNQGGLPPSDLNAALEQHTPPGKAGRNQPQCKLTIKNELTMSQDTFQYRGAAVDGQADEQRLATPDVLPQGQLVETERETAQPADLHADAKK